MSGLYLHIPFCKQACSYCDFYFVTRQQEKQHFVDALIEEIRSKKNTRFSQEAVETIYFGGGTPSLLSSHQIENILSAIDDVFPLTLKEVTIEMNPDDVSKEYLEELHLIGVNRASMGVQTFDEELLTFMNRAHSRKEALTCLELLCDSNLASFSVDLIYGNPNQTIEMLKRDVETILGFDPPHISAYSLTIEPKTRLGKQLELGRLIPPEDDIVAQHFDLIESTLTSAGIHQYEVSNFAQKGFEAMHNSAYWFHENYLGLGPGAHSFWWDEGNKSAKRWNNEPNLKKYIQETHNQENDLEVLNLSELAEEHIMLGLRTRKGINTANLLERYEYSFNEKQQMYLQKKQREGKLIVETGKIRFTKEGVKISDALVLDLVT